jgi:hypothetical protein
MESLELFCLSSSLYLQCWQLGFSFIYSSS